MSNELSVGKVLVATESSNVIPANAGIQSLDPGSPSGMTNGEATESAQASSSATAKADATIGSGTILTGQTSAFINNNQVTAQSKVFITVESPTAQTLAVTEKVPGTGFKVQIKLPEAVEVKFSWWIIN